MYTSRYLNVYNIHIYIISIYIICIYIYTLCVFPIYCTELNGIAPTQARGKADRGKGKRID
jgi:hypothetical protein